MSDDLKHAQYLEAFFVSEDVSAVKARAIAATLRSLDAEVTRLRAALAAAQPPAAMPVPPGMALVPVDVTAVMVKAANRVCRDNERCKVRWEPSKCKDCIQETAGDLRAALAAAQPVPATGAQPRMPTDTDIARLLVGSAVWHAAPLKVQFGADMLMADIALTADETLTIYAHRHGVNAAPTAPTGSEG